MSEFPLSDLGEEYLQFIEHMVATGRYMDEADVVRDALRHMEDRTSSSDLKEADREQAG